MVYRYLLTKDIPEIDGLAGDILVWDHPRVSLYRRVRLGDQFTLLNLLPEYWKAVLLGEEDDFIPLDAAPRAAELIAALPRAHAGNPRTPPAESESPQLRLLA